MASKVSFNNEISMVEDYKPTYCVACGDQIRRFAMLVCLECLDVECDKFSKMVKELEE